MSDDATPAPAGPKSFLNTVHDNLSTIRNIAVIVGGGVLAVWGFFDQLDKKFEKIDDLAHKNEEISNNMVLMSNTLNKVGEKVERVSENLIGGERRTIVVEEKVRLLEDKVRRASEVNKSLPFRYIDHTNNAVTDGRPGEYVKVTLYFDKFRSDCNVKQVRYIKDASEIMHDVTDNASVENPMSLLGSNQNVSYLLKLPDATILRAGPARFQIRSTYTCIDGGSFFVTSPWLSFRVIDPLPTNHKRNP